MTFMKSALSISRILEVSIISKEQGKDHESGLTTDLRLVLQHKTGQKEYQSILLSALLKTSFQVIEPEEELAFFSWL